jgi:S1-C subfamily serine protease
MKTALRNKLYVFIEKICILFIVIILGILIVSIGIYFSNQEKINNPNDSIENNCGDVVNITSCNRLHILAITFPDYILYAHGFGSGITLKNGYILSVEHIVHKEELLPFINGQYYATIIKKSGDFDLALLKISNFAKPFKLAKSISIGEKVLVWGYPAGIQGFIHGWVANFNENLIFLDIKVIQGMSGGAVINEKGELLGVFRGGIGSPDMLGVAVNFPRIKKFLKGTPAEYK